MISSPGKVLIIAAHPDDEVLGCGGTIARLAEEGKEIFCVFLGKGKASRFEDEEENSAVIKQERKILLQESARAGKILGIKDSFFLDFPDQKYETVSLQDVVDALREIFRKVNPSMVFTHHVQDINLDHHITWEAVERLCREIEQKDLELYSFIIPAASEWHGVSFAPNAIVDITSTFSKKEAALRAYESELPEFPHPRSLKAVQGLAQYWGSQGGVAYGESFFLEKISF